MIIEVVILIRLLLSRIDLSRFFLFEIRWLIWLVVGVLFFFSCSMCVCDVVVREVFDFEKKVDRYSSLMIMSVGLIRF